MIILTIYFILLGLLSYSFLFANVNDKGINGTISKYLTISLPLLIKNNIIKFFGIKQYNDIYDVYDYIINKRNPILIIAYIILINISFLLWLMLGQIQLPTILISYQPTYYGIIGIIICHISFYIACTEGPGIINNHNINCFNYHKYDNLMYVNNNICKTCNIIKPSRSKHCNLCGYCVPIFDHHCVWLNQCIGELNYKYFLLFLIIHVIFFTYGSYVIGGVIISEIYERNLFNSIFIESSTRIEMKATYSIIGRYLISKNIILFSVFLFCIIMDIAIFSFLCYHIWLISRGCTTNESYKWSNIKRVHKRLTASYNEYIKKGGQPKQQQQQQQDEQQDEQEEGEDIVKSTKKGSDKKDKKDKKKTSKKNSNYDQNDNNQVGCVPDIISNNDQSNQSIVEDIPKEITEDPGELPANIYNKGFLANVVDIIFPPAVPLLINLDLPKATDKVIDNNNDDDYEIINKDDVK